MGRESNAWRPCSAEAASAFQRYSPAFPNRCCSGWCSAPQFRTARCSPGPTRIHPAAARTARTALCPSAAIPALTATSQAEQAALARAQEVSLVGRASVLLCWAHPTAGPVHLAMAHPPMCCIQPTLDLQAFATGTRHSSSAAPTRVTSATTRMAGPTTETMRAAQQVRQHGQRLEQCYSML